MSTDCFGCTPRLPWRQHVMVSWLTLLVFLGIAVLPVLFMVWQSFLLDGSFTLSHYKPLITDTRVFGLLFKSFSMALGATVLSFIVGLPLAALLCRTTFQGKTPATALVFIPLFIPSHLHALAWIHLLGEQGFLSRVSSLVTAHASLPINIYHPVGGAFILFLAYYPLFVLVVMTGLSTIDYTQEEAGHLSSSSWRVWRYITLPLASPYIMAGLIFVFIFSFFNYGVPSMLQIPSYPVEIFTRFSAFYDQAGATSLAVPVIGIAALLLFLQQKQLQGRQLVAISGKRYSNASGALPRSRVAHLFIWSLIAVSVILPVIALLYQAGSLKSFQAAWSTSQTEIITSVLFAAGAATLATVLAYILSVYKQEKKGYKHDLLHALLFLPFAFPATLFGIGLIHLWNRPWTSWVYSGISIVLIAYIARFIPFASALISANLQQISPSIREAACMTKCSRRSLLFRIHLPLARKGLTMSWLVVFIFSMGELGATLLVIPPGYGTVSLKIYTLMHYGAGPLVAALAVLLIGINVAVATCLLAHFNHGAP